MTYKYSTLAKLKQAYDSGELSKDHRLVLDNDSSHVYVKVDEDWVCVFNGPGYEIREDALTLLGIPWEPA